MSSIVVTSEGKVPSDLGRPELLRLYQQMVLLRQFESTAHELYRSGRWPGFIHLYVGEEATAVGVCAALRPVDWITSTHRGHGHALAKGVPVKAVMAELFGKATGCCGGRGGSMHLYAPEVGLLGTCGIVAGSIPLAVGAALSARTRGTDQVGVAFFGDGASNHGAFLESLNFATVQKLPVIFLCENNLYATATALSKATANTDIASKAAAFGAVGVAVDGNDVLAVRQVTREAVARARAGQGPTLIESRTYRWFGHHEGEPPWGLYRTEEEVKAWQARCPIAAYRNLLVSQGLATAEELAAITQEVDREIAEAVAFGDAAPNPDPARVYDHLYAEPLNPPRPPPPTDHATVQRSWLEAVRDGIAEEMRREPTIFCLGEGIAERGGCFGHTKDLWKEFGDRRVVDTPICELAFTGAATGAAATGCRPLADLMFADFLFEAASPLVHQAAKLRYLSNGQVTVPLVVRAPMGMIKNAGGHHSGAYYPMWAHVPGLIVVVPSTPADAKALMKTALRAHDPVLFLEHKALFGTKGPVPTGEHLLPFGQAAILRAGTHLTIATCGLLTHRCLEAAEQLQQQGLSCEVIDLRTIVPLDVDTVAGSLHRTGHLLVVDEAWSMFGVGAELAAAMMELAFDELDAPVGRLHTERVSYPFSPSLESSVTVTTQKIIEAAQAVVAGRAPVPQHPRVDRAPPARATAGVLPPAARPTAVAPAPNAPNCVTMAGVLVTLPNMDLTVTEATVVRWLKQVGDAVKMGEPVVEVETDKAVVEIEAPVAGTLAAILAPAETVVPLKEAIAVITPA